MSVHTLEAVPVSLRQKDKYLDLNTLGFLAISFLSVGRSVSQTGTQCHSLKSGHPMLARSEDSPSIRRLRVFIANVSYAEQKLQPTLN